LFPKKVEAEASAVPRLVADWELAHPTLQRFEAVDLRRLLLRDAFVIDPDDNWEPLARFQNTHPALLARMTGSGPILVFANPLNREWSELPVNRVFVPLMREWASWLTGLVRTEDEIRTAHPGFEEARSPGIYEDEDGRIDVVAAQPLEMNPGTVEVDAFRTALAIPEPTPELIPDPPGVPKDRERPNEWWPWIVVALIGLLVTENYMSDRGKNSVIEPKTPHPDEA
jgi:hypothetical protein